MRFITVEAYAKAFNFYVEKNKFKYRKNDKKFIDKMDMIIKQNPQRCFNLYKDLKSI